MEAIGVLDQAGRRLAQATKGSSPAAFAEFTLESEGTPAGTLEVSTTQAQEYVEEVKRLTGRDAVLIADGMSQAGTLPFPALAAEAHGRGEEAVRAGHDGRCGAGR